MSTQPAQQEKSFTTEKLRRVQQKKSGAFVMGSV